MDLTHVRFRGSPPAVAAPAVPVASYGADRLASQAVDAAVAVSPLASFVLAQAGLDAARYREAPLKRRSAACLRALKVDSEQAALDALAARPMLMPVALNALLIGVSEFFRDERVFDTLRRVAVSEMALRRRPPRILSVGCSHGAELYSAAMLLAEAQLLDGAELIGVDCRADAVRAASAGIFSETFLSTMDAALLSRYFSSHASGWRVDDRLRRRTHWRTLDATRACPPGPWQIAFCRNLSIYLQGPAAAEMVTRLVAQLAPGGFLVVGKAERPPAGLPLTEVARCVYRTHAA
jgi:chemotaxis protein methyltransferase CheR